MRLVVVGDSVHWGQGLCSEHKLVTSVAAQLGAAFDLPAHSGAIIGAGSTISLPAVDSEVPFAYPTIIQQCDTFANAPGDVDLVILNGGVNDINVRTLVDPLTDPKLLSALITTYCGTDMRRLIEHAGRKFTRAQFLVTSYFPILSHESDLTHIDSILAAYFIDVPTAFMTRFAQAPATPALARLFIWEKVVALALQFWRESTIELREAVRVCDAQGPGAGRVVFVEVPFTERNAMFAPDPHAYVAKSRAPQDHGCIYGRCGHWSGASCWRSTSTNFWNSGLKSFLTFGHIWP